MVTNILRAISKMLEQNQNTNSQELGVRVGCAKTMLDEVIKGLEDNGSTYTLPLPNKTTTSNAELKVEPREKTPEYMISVDDQKCLKLIKGLPLDTEVELDKKRMTHKDAIGQKFQKIRILI